MGKKNRRKKDSLLNNSSLSTQETPNSSYDSFNVSNGSVNEGIIPEKLIISSVKSAGCDTYAKCLKSEWEDVVFLHPSVMRAFDIQDLVLIKGDQRTILCTAYPLSSLKKDLIVFPKGNCPYENQELVSLCTYKDKIPCAEEVIMLFNGEKDTKQIIFRLSNKYVYIGLTIKWKLFNQEHQCTVQNIKCLPNSSKFYTVNYRTVIKTELRKKEDEDSSPFIGGLEKPLKSIKKYMENFLNTDTFNSSVSYGKLMLNGPSGTGKSLLLKAILEECNIFTQHILWYKICAMSQSEVKRELEAIFQRAADRAPSIIIIDEFNHLCPSKSNAASIHLYISKVLSHLLQVFDETKVMVITVTNDSDYDSSVLQTSKKLLKVISFQIPTAVEREDILKKLLNSKDHELTFDQIQQCARLAHGFTGKDLFEVIENAQMIACKRECSNILDSDDYLNTLRGRNCGSIKFCEMSFSVKMRKPSIVSASDLKVKKVQWSDIGGMTDVKEKLKQLVEWPLAYQKAFKHFNATPSRGALMYGPPGCSKTMIAKALATECELNFISKNASDLYDKYVGESEKAVRDLFAMAKAKSPCIIFLDEIDALVTERGSSSSSSGVGNRIVNTMLTEMDGVEELRGVFIIAATNRPDMLDDALVRNGRINHFIYVPLPDAITREEILKLSMKKRIVSDDFDFKVVAEKTEGYSGAEIVNLCNEAALEVLIKDPKVESPVFNLHHFERAINHVPPRTNKKMISFYEKFNEKHCSK